MRRRQEDRSRLDRLESSVDEIRHALERVELMFLMKDPSVPAGADAYEGLRRSLILSREDRMARLVDLARIDASLRRVDGPGGTEAILGELLTAAGIDRLESPSGGDREAFEIFGSDADGSELVVLEPAYVHGESGALIRTGRARFDAAQQIPDSEQSEASVGTSPAPGSPDPDETAQSDPGQADPELEAESGGEEPSAPSNDTTEDDPGDDSVEPDEPGEAGARMEREERS